MSTRKERSERKYNKIREAYGKYDMKKLRLAHVLQELAEKYDLAPDTIYCIIKQTGRYSPNNKHLNNN